MMSRLDARLQAAERADVLVELLRRRLSELTDRLVQRKRGEIARGPFVDLVIHIGDVAHIGDMPFPVEPSQEAEEHIEDDDGSRVADVGQVVNGRSADIEAHVRGIDRNEFALLARERVVELQRHGKFRAWASCLPGLIAGPRKAASFSGLGFPRRGKGKAAAPAGIGASRGGALWRRDRAGPQGRQQGSIMRCARRIFMRLLYRPALLAVNRQYLSRSSLTRNDGAAADEALRNRRASLALS